MQFSKFCAKASMLSFIVGISPSS
uniref:Uncharacterized protein n=1 Tax=Arundo donax TaxID=35708 RepID=A0A0A9E2C0_ARUDO